MDFTIIIKKSKFIDIIWLNLKNNTVVILQYIMDQEIEKTYRRRIFVKKQIFLD